jgi:hypothetical protein
VPDLSQLEKREWPLYSIPSCSRFDLGKQVKLARDLSRKYREEWNFTSDPKQGNYHYNNGYFEAVDAEVAYSPGPSVQACIRTRDWDRTHYSYIGGCSQTK